jgi:hypothetical protein
MLMRKLWILLSINISICFSAIATGETLQMYDTVKNAIHNADAIMYGIVRFADFVKKDGKELFHVEVQPLETLKGAISGPEYFSIEIPSAGKETPSLEKGCGYLFFLKAVEGASKERGGMWQIVPGDAPALVEEKEKKAFLKYARASVKIWSSNATPQEIKDHLLRMLNSGVTFFQSDAAREALEIGNWDGSELAYMIELLEGKRNIPFENPLDREYLTTLVVSQGQPDILLPFIREQFMKGVSDAVYFGFSRRDDKVAETVLDTLFQDTEYRVQANALRTAGLLRREDLIDRFEKHYIQHPSVEITKAIAEARELVKRDY